MAVLIRRCLLLGSLLTVALLAEAADWLLPLSGRQQYAVQINARGAELTGICIIKTDSVGESRGAIVNEFGIHAMDFTLSSDRRKVKLQNVMPQMDRWYIRRIVRGDLKALFNETRGTGCEVRGRRQVTVEEDGTVVLTNTKYKLRYSFKQIDDTER